MTGSGASGSLLLSDLEWAVPPARGLAGGTDRQWGGAELKQGKRKELILLFRGHSQQARDLRDPGSAHLATYEASLGSLCIVTSRLALA